MLYGEYEESDDGGAVGSDRSTGIGIVSDSEIDALGPRRGAGDRRGRHVGLALAIATSKATDDDNGTGVSSNFDDFQYVKAGALINF